MDSVTSTVGHIADLKMSQENILLEVIKELCVNMLSPKLKGKVMRIMADCELTHHSSLHKLNTADETTTTLLGFMKQTNTELTYEEQYELNQAIIQHIQKALPLFETELLDLKQSAIDSKSRQEQVKELQTSLDEKIKTLEDQEDEKVELMMEWLNHRLGEVNKFSEDSSELLTLRTKILELKSKIIHLQILQNIFTETNQSIKSYTEIHKDLKDSIKETEQRIKQYKELIDADFK